MSKAGKNAYQTKSSEKKLRGEVFTPVWFAEAVVRQAAAAVSAGSSGIWGVVVDPACGDGAFLEAVVRVRVAMAAVHGESSSLGTGTSLTAGLYGFDLDPSNVEKARARLRAVAAELGLSGEVTVEAGDALAPAGWIGEEGPSVSGALGAMKARTGDFARGIDLVVGNPPYVDAKRLSEVEKINLRAWFPDVAGGAADLCLYFLHHFVGHLAPGGRLAFIVPNKLLIANFAKQFRQRLVEDRLLHELMFVSHLAVFSKTAVYPVVMVLGNEPAPKLTIHRPETVEELRENKGQTRDVPHDLYSVTAPKCIFPMPSQAVEAALLEKLCSQARVRIRDVLDIRWTISFHATGLRDRYVFEEKPDSPYAMPFVGGARFSGNAEVQRYTATWAGTWIDYDEDRARKDKNPLPARSLFSGGVIPICQNALRLRAAWTKQGWAFKDTFLLGRPIVARGEPASRPSGRFGPPGGLFASLADASDKDSERALSEHPRAIVALLNSDLAHFFYAHVFYASHINGGYLHYLAPYVAEIPLGTWDVTLAERADALVRKLELAPEDDGLDLAVQELVATVFGLSASEASAVANFAGRG